MHQPDPQAEQLGAMLTEFYENLVAEISASNALAMTALRYAVTKAGDDRAAIGKRLLDDGLKALWAANYPQIPADRRDAFNAKLEASWTTLVTDALR